MAGKMNWDRVRKENLSRRSGSEWIGQDATPITANEASKQKANDAPTPKRPVVKVAIPGCTCNKTLGFHGSHDKRCALFWRRTPKRIPAPLPAFSLKDFAKVLKKVDQASTTETFLKSLEQAVGSNSKINSQDRDRIGRMIHELREDFAEYAGSDINRIPTSDKLLGMVRNGSDVYLQAKHKSAIRLVESVARQLNVKVHRFRYSKSTPQPYSLTFQKVFTEGGIFCIEQMEIAPKSWQFWLKSAVDNSSSNSKRHANFALIVMASKSPHDLWDGQIDRAFLDRLAYLKASV